MHNNPVIPETDLKKLLHLKDNLTEGTFRKFYKWKSLNYFLFSYLCGNLTTAELAYLKFKNVKEGYLEIPRNNINHRFPLPPEIREIFDTLAKEPRESDHYAFLILIPNSTLEEESHEIRKLTDHINENMQNICRELALAYVLQI